MERCGTVARTRSDNLRALTHRQKLCDVVKPACFPGVVLPAGATFSRRSARIHRNEQFVLVVAKGWAGPTVEASWPATTAFEPACLSLTRWLPKTCRLESRYPGRHPCLGFWMSD